ncbi:MAG: peptide deformylase [Clostridia bacterium]|nr:peptide deformylase [Clostridia bacterium]
MVRAIVRDQFFLRIPSRPATAADAPVADDLLDTLHANAERCVGMAANMIGESVRIIALSDGERLMEMFNPVIIKRDGPFDCEEGCLSLDGVRPVRRYRSIKVQWQTRDMKPRVKSFAGFTAQIIQHEVDHLSGILI